LKTCYVIGFPLGHSLSPVMYETAFRALGLDYKFEPRPVRPGELGEFMASTMRMSKVRGASVTIPHKVAVIGHLDELDSVASRIGAVNTVVNNGGWLKGYNTDGIGAIRALEEAHGSLSDAKAVLMGAGGAARAIAYHLSLIVQKLIILNRTPRNADSLVKDFAAHPECRAKITAGPLDEKHLGEAIVEADILVNATSLGMTPNIIGTPVDVGLLRPGLLVFDVVYNPLMTRLLREAEAAGARTLTGSKMLAYQGAEAFKLWTGAEAPVELMLRTVEEALGAVRE